jgi:hypothetical protein
MAKGPARSLQIAERGIKTSRDFRDFMSALMSDLISGKVTAGVGNAACNAGGKMLKMVDLEYKHGTDPERKPGLLSIAFEDPSAALTEGSSGGAAAKP